MSFTQITEITPDDLLNAGQGPAVNGPLAGLDLTADNFNYNLYQYPPGAVEASAQDNAHQIVFYINVPQSSYWSNPDAANAPDPVANRDTAATQFGLREDASGDEQGGTGAAFGVNVKNAIISRKSKRTTAAISLYVPNTLAFTQDMQYENVSLTASLGVLDDANAVVSGIMNGKGRIAGAALTSMTPDVLKMFGINDHGIGTGINGIQDAVLSSLGLADNPQNYLMFKQIDFRKFQFSFILTPENAADTTLINQIIYLFRFHSAPEVATGGLGRFFIPPSDFDIDVLHNGGRNTNIPRISTCVCNSVSVYYGANGEWSTIKDGQPIQTRLDLVFTETEIMTKDRIQGGF